MAFDWIDNLTPFGAEKLLAHIPRWSLLAEGGFPAPAMVAVDVSAKCNLNCVWCNAGRAKTGLLMPDAVLAALPGQLRRWGVLSVSLCGGGEPTLHPRFNAFVIALAKQGIGTGIITNGLREIPASVASVADYVALSIDAGTRETFRKTKGADKFDVAVKHLRPGYTFKFVAHPENVHEIPLAAQIAKDAGCRYLHIRPANPRWYLDEHVGSTDWDRFVDKAREIETPDFKVVGRASRAMPSKLPFKHCHAIRMCCALTPNIQGFNIELCQDRRGDPMVCLATNVRDFRAWGGVKHRRLRPDISKCPTCSFQAHNAIFEQVVAGNALGWQFL